jgi:tetratricopeptide (TPR) repeat protein
MYRSMAFVFILGFATTVCAQSGLDSLLNVLKNNPKESDKTILYGKISWAYIGQGNHTLARLYADSVRMVATRLGDSVGIYKAQYYYGVIGRYTGEYAAALEYFDNYLRFHASRGDSARVAGVLYQIAVVHGQYGNYEKSLAVQQRSLAIEEAAANAYSVGYILNSIGIIYKETRSYDDAILTFNKALAIFDSLQELVDKTNVLVNLGNTYSAMKRFDQAMPYYHQALEIDKRIGKERGVAMSLANIAFVHDSMGAYDSALVYHRKALAIREKFSDAEDLSRSLIGVGLGYLQLGKFSEARPYLLRALEVSKRTHSKPLLQDVHLNLSNLYQRMKQPVQALNHLEQYQVYKDSIFNEQTMEKISELEIKHAVSDKIKQIALLKKEKQIQQQEAGRQATIRKALIAGFLFVVVLAAFGVYAFRQRLLVMRKDKEIREANLRHQLSELKIQALRSQINPHFMFNCLNSINRMIVRGDNEEASLYLKKFSKLLRLIVENGEANRVSLENELTLIESYIQLEELRFKNKIGYEIVVDDGIEKENTFLPPMILQPFVENSIWHGLMNKSADETGRIRIAVKEEDETLVCMIEDNGVGREKSRELKEDIPGKTQSVGISITEERLKLLSRDRLRNLIKFVDLKDNFETAIGTRVEIRIPLS